MIDILIPVLARPQNARPMIESLRQATVVEYRVLFLCSLGDDEEIDACHETGCEIFIDDFGERGQYPRKMNAGFRLTEHPFLLLGADDIEFQPGWDVEVLRVAQETGAGVIGTNDCANPQVMRGHFSTHPLVRRSYVDEQGGSLDGPGVLIHPGYSHNFCERELAHLAQSRGQWVFASESKIVHRHPCWGTAPEDDTYRKGVANMGEDQWLFWDRAQQWGGVGLLPQEISWIKRTRRARYSHRR